MPSSPLSCHHNLGARIGNQADATKRYLHTGWLVVVCTTSKIDKELNKEEEEAAKARGASKHTPTSYQVVSNTPSPSRSPPSA
jgi:hypothetical protein